MLNDFYNHIFSSHDHKKSYLQMSDYISCAVTEENSSFDSICKTQFSLWEFLTLAH